MKIMQIIFIFLFSLITLSCSDTQDPVIPPENQQETPQPDEDAAEDEVPDAEDPAAQVLVFTKTEGYRHASISNGLDLLGDLAVDNNFEITATEDSGMFNSDQLAGFDLVIFLNTTGDILDNSQQQAFEAYMKNGGSFMGVHSATDTEYDWPWYGQLVGAYFDGHPEVQQAIIKIKAPSHPSAKHLDAQWNHRDEFYNFRDFDASKFTVILEMDESSYEGGTMGSFHPIAWYGEVQGGKVFYTGLGHTEEAYSDPEFRKHIAGGIEYSLSH